MDSPKSYFLHWYSLLHDYEGVYLPGPFSHDEACTILSKITKYSWRNVILKEIPNK